MDNRAQQTSWSTPLWSRKGIARPGCIGARHLSGSLEYAAAELKCDRESWPQWTGDRTWEYAAAGFKGVCEPGPRWSTPLGAERWSTPLRLREAIASPAAVCRRESVGYAAAELKSDREPWWRRVTPLLMSVGVRRVRTEQRSRVLPVAGRSCSARISACEKGRIMAAGTRLLGAWRGPAQDGYGLADRTEWSPSRRQEHASDDRVLVLAAMILKGRALQCAAEELMK
ncbi:hypothetical protein N9L68_04445 [bacterium]|nr:hypothetical protein [bacterium]